MGTFVKSLVRNNQQIKEDRATAIQEDAELAYKRMVEDLEVQIKKFRVERENMLDLSSKSNDNLILASDFNANQYVNRDVELGISIRNAEIALKIATERYGFLFKKED